MTNAVDAHYDWVPGPEAYSQALLEAERLLEREVAKRSVTELEILHGVLNNPDMAGRAFFYVRDDAATAAMVETTLGELREQQVSDNQNKLAELKQAIIAAGKTPALDRQLDCVE